MLSEDFEEERQARIVARLRERDYDEYLASLSAAERAEIRVQDERAAQRHQVDVEFAREKRVREAKAEKTWSIVRMVWWAVKVGAIASFAFNYSSLGLVTFFLLLLVLLEFEKLNR